MRLRLAIAALAILGISCVHETRVAAGAPPPAPASRSIWDRQINNATDAGDGDYQLRVLREKVAAEPDSVPDRLELASAYRDRGYPDVALEICRLAAARFPASGEAELGLVQALYSVHRPAEGIASLDQFLRAHPQDGQAYYSWLGLLHDQAGQWQAGEPDHRKAIALAPKVAYLHNNLGYNLLMQKKNGEAAAEFREALRLDPGSQLARNNLGLALANQNAGREALANWQSGSDPAAAHNNLAAVWIEKGNYVEARKELEIALEYNKQYPAALKNLELVSRLDGQPATLPANPGETRWARWKAGFLKLFVGPLEDSRTEPVKTAPAPATGEEQ